MGGSACTTGVSSPSCSKTCRTASCGWPSGAAGVCVRCARSWRALSGSRSSCGRNWPCGGGGCRPTRRWRWCGSASLRPGLRRPAASASARVPAVDGGGWDLVDLLVQFAGPRTKGAAFEAGPPFGAEPGRWDRRQAPRQRSFCAIGSGGEADVGDVLVLAPLRPEVDDLVDPCVVQLLVVAGGPCGDDLVPVTDVHRPGFHRPLVGAVHL